MRYRAVIAVLLLFAGLNSTAIAGSGYSNKSGISLGINTLQVRYGVNEYYKVSGNLAYSERIFIVGARLARQHNLNEKSLLYLGVESDLVNFDHDSILGKGHILYIPLGLEQYVSPGFSVSCELGPAYVWIKSNAVDVSQSGLDWMWNLYLTFYIGKRQI